MTTNNNGASHRRFEASLTMIIAQTIQRRGKVRESLISQEQCPLNSFSHENIYINFYFVIELKNDKYLGCS